MIEILLSRLERVRKLSDGYMACCPAHDDKSPSLSITERNGKILLHCFAGCHPHDVLDSAQLTWGDLFSDPMDAAENSMSNLVGYRLEQKVRAHDQLDLDRAVLIYARAVWNQGRELGVEDAARVQLAIERLEAANVRSA